MNTRKMQQKLDQVILNRFGGSVEWGSENSTTWLRVTGEITPHDYEIVSQLIADTTGRNFYFHSVGMGVLEGPIDAEIHDYDTGEELKTPGYFSTQNWRTPLKEYGFEFQPKEKH